MMTMTADRDVARARFSASDRPVPPDLDVVAAIEARRNKGPRRGQPGALERVLRSALGRLERAMASSRARRITRRKELAAQGKAQSPLTTAYSDETLAQHRALVEAIRRVEAGTYGICLACQAPIEPERLEANPTATHCVECAARVS